MISGDVFQFKIFGDCQTLFVSSTFFVYIFINTYMYISATGHTNKPFTPSFFPSAYLDSSLLTGKRLWERKSGDLASALQPGRRALRKPREPRPGPVHPDRWFHMGVSLNGGTSTPKLSTLIGFSIINHTFWGTTIFGNTHIRSHAWRSKIDGLVQIPFKVG